MNEEQRTGAKAEPKAERSPRRTSVFTRLPIQEQINFARHLSITIKAGLPIFEGLRIVRKQTGSKRFGRILDKTITDVSNGQPLADALERHRAFSPYFISVIQVGEASGTLTDNLIYLSEELKKDKNLKSKVRSAFIYPSVILVATAGIVSFLVFFILPKVLPIFQSLRIKLPLTTRILITASSFLVDYWAWVIGGTIGFIVFFRLLLMIYSIRYLFHRALLFIPIASSIIVNFNLANFSRIMAILLKSGVRIVSAVKITSGTFNNLVYSRMLAYGADRVQKGEQLAETLKEHKILFPPLFSNMVEIGENTGNLEENLSYLSDFYTEEVDASVYALTTLLEPLLLLIMGAIVGFIAVSIITPIYEISSSLQV